MATSVPLPLLPLPIEAKAREGKRDTLDKRLANFLQQAIALLGRQRLAFAIPQQNTHFLRTHTFYLYTILQQALLFAAMLAWSRAQVDALPGPTLLEFGTPWCGHCRAAQPSIAEAMMQHPHLRHLKIEDGPGRRLGRSFKVKLWPTLVFLHDGKEVGRLVRPADPAEVGRALKAIDGY